MSLDGIPLVLRLRGIITLERVFGNGYLNLLASIADVGILTKPLIIALLTPCKNNLQPGEFCALDQDVDNPKSTLY